MANGGNVLKSNAILYELDKKATVTLTRVLMLGFCTGVETFLLDTAKVGVASLLIVIIRVCSRHRLYVHLNAPEAL